MKPIPVLVTGGAGYVGSHACKALSRAGYLPITVDSLVSGHRAAAQWGPLIVGDIGEPEVLKVAFEHRPVAVLHFAAFAYVGESVHSPDKYYRNNVANTLNLLDAMRQQGCRHIVFSSTCSTYGIPEAGLISEDHPQRPINPYGRSKLMVEQILRDYGHAYGIDSVSLRYFNAAGADPEGDLGEDHEPETHLIPSVIQSALGQRSHVQVLGADYPTPDGTAVRDYTHVTDLADAHVLALGHLTSGKGTAALNLGTGHGHSVLDVIAEVERAMGVLVPRRDAPRRPGDPPVLVANPALARAVLGWVPKYRSLADVVGTAVMWHRSRQTLAA
ncbi:MAG: UDP-glucose 4-epimerase GalE [Pseudomonadota bacterium]